MQAPVKGTKKMHWYEQCGTRGNLKCKYSVILHILPLFTAFINRTMSKECLFFM